MKHIVLVTSNNRKIGEARAALSDFNIEVMNKQFEINEIQARDPIIIARCKAEDAFKLAGEPIVITDTSWDIPALNGFPGGYMKDVADWLNPSDFLNLLNDYDDRTINFTETIVYKDDKEIKVFSQNFSGKIADKPRGTGNPIEQLAEFDGFTIGERQQQGRFSHDPKDYVWYQFAKWFVEQNK